MSDRDCLTQLLVCRLCNERFVDPIILPCGKSVCSKHVHIESQINIFKCLICGKKHSVPTEGFCKNEELNILLGIGINFIYTDDMLSSKNKKALELCDDFEELIKKIETLSKDPSLFVYEYFSKIKSDLDLHREQCIQSINDNYHRVLNEIEDSEKKCKFNLKIIDQNILRLNESLISLKEKHVSFLSLSKRPNLNNDVEWIDFKLDIEKQILKSNYMIRKFQSELLSRKSYEFKLKTTFSEYNFGDLFISSDNFPCENRLEGTIKFEVDQFKSFRYKKMDHYDKDWCIIDNIRWTAYVRIKENEEYDQYLSLYVKPDCKEFSNPIKTQITFKLLKIDGTIYDNESYKHTFERKVANGFRDYCSLKEIFNVENKIYNLEKDSIKIEVDIKIIK